MKHRWHCLFSTLQRVLRSFRRFYPNMLIATEPRRWWSTSSFPLCACELVRLLHTYIVQLTAKYISGVMSHVYDRWGADLHLHFFFFSVLFPQLFALDVLHCRGGTRLLLLLRHIFLLANMYKFLLTLRSPVAQPTSTSNRHTYSIYIQNIADSQPMRCTFTVLLHLLLFFFYFFSSVVLLLRAFCSAKKFDDKKNGEVCTLYISLIRSILRAAIYIFMLNSTIIMYIVLIFWCCCCCCFVFLPQLSAHCLFRWCVCVNVLTADCWCSIFSPVSMMAMLYMIRIMHIMTVPRVKMVYEENREGEGTSPWLIKLMVRKKKPPAHHCIAK